MTQAKRTAQQALAELGAISDKAERTAAVDLWLRKIQTFVTNLSARICVDRGINRTHHGDDVHQIVSLEIAALVEEVHERPALANEIVNFNGFLETRARQSVTAWMNSSQGYNHMSEMTGWARRRSELERVRDEQRHALNREPSDVEIVTAANAKFAARRSNPTKQGMVFKVEDLHMRGQHEDVDLHTAHPSVVAHDDEDTSALHATERIELVLLTIKACEKESLLLGKVARVYLNPALGDSYDEEPSAAHIARVLGIKASTARANRIRVREIARRVLLTKWGIVGVNETIDLEEITSAPEEEATRSVSS